MVWYSEACTMNVSFFTTLTDPPALKTIPDQRIKTGDTLSITCRVTSSNPAPNEYKWTKVGGGTFSQTGPVLTIPNIQLLHAGTYRCTAVNTMVPTNGRRQQGTDTEDVTVDVQCVYTNWIVSFFCVHGKWTWVRHFTNPVNRAAVVGRFVTASPKFISNECRKIRHSFLLFTISSNIKHFSESNREKHFWNSLLNRLAMTSFK